MAMLGYRVSKVEEQSEQFDKRLADYQGEMRQGFARIERAIESGTDRTDRAIDGIRKLLIGLLIAIIGSMATIIVLLLIIIIGG